jgi:hypothetical protein
MKNLSKKQQVLAFAIFTMLVWTHAQLNPVDISIKVKSETRLLFTPEPVETESAFDVLPSADKLNGGYEVSANAGDITLLLPEEFNRVRE